MAVRITCINKDRGNHENPHLAISYFGWVNPDTGENGKSDRVTLYEWVRKGGVAYVQDQSGRKAQLVPKVSKFGNPFLQTQTDYTPTDNLLWLPECG